VNPPRVSDRDVYWTQAPPIPSARRSFWIERIAAGWRPNRRIRAMGYVEAAEFYGVYVWEYTEVLRPALSLGASP